MPGASAAATSWPASAARSSRCRRRSICSARCASRRKSRERSCSPRPIPPTRTASIVKWPERSRWRGPREPPARSWCSSTASLAAYLRRGERELLLFAPETEPQRSRLIHATARSLAELSAPRGMLLAEIDGAPATSHVAASRFVEAGFSMTAMGLQRRPVPGRSVHANPEPEPEPNPEPNPEGEHEPSTENVEG